MFKLSKLLRIFDRTPEPTQIQELLDRMQSHPDEFECTEYVLIHKPSKVEIWIANGLAHYHIYRPVQIDFNLDDKYRFRDALVLWMKVFLGKAMSGMLPS